jgi:hypothetical protein
LNFIFCRERIYRTAVVSDIVSLIDAAADKTSGKQYGSGIGNIRPHVDHPFTTSTDLTFKKSLSKVAKQNISHFPC